MFHLMSNVHTRYVQTCLMFCHGVPIIEVNLWGLGIVNSPVREDCEAAGNLPRLWCWQLELCRYDPTNGLTLNWEFCSIQRNETGILPYLTLGPLDRCPVMLKLTSAGSFADVRMHHRTSFCQYDDAISSRCFSMEIDHRTVLKRWYYKINH